MNCDEVSRFLEADVDGELDLVRHVELQAHLRSCPACVRRAESLRDLRRVLNKSLPRYAASPEFAQKINASLKLGTPASVTKDSVPAVIHRFWSASRLVGMAASLLFAVFIGYTWDHAGGRESRLMDEAVSSHIRSLQVNHLTDVASTEQHTVKPWFAGKLDFSPPVLDLAAAGFPLTGGRLERIGGAPAAALVYHRRQHAINLFIWPSADSPLALERRERNGYQIESWTSNGFNFLAVSEIPANELTEFANLFRGQPR